MLQSHREDEGRMHNEELFFLPVITSCENFNHYHLSFLAMEVYGFMLTYSIIENPTAELEMFVLAY